MAAEQTRSARAETEFVSDSAIYRRVILETVPAARRFLWLATSDIKDLYVDTSGRCAPFLEQLSNLIAAGVSVRLIHAKEPGPLFMRDFDRYPNLARGLERLLCPRAHFKSLVADGKIAYTGSANLTGAGMGAKSAGRRNFEEGILTTDPGLVRAIMEHFDSVWMGAHCPSCRRKRFCADFHDILRGCG